MTADCALSRWLSNTGLDDFDKFNRWGSLFEDSRARERKLWVKFRYGLVCRVKPSSWRVAHTRPRYHPRGRQIGGLLRFRQVSTSTPKNRHNGSLPRSPFRHPGMLRRYGIYTLFLRSLTMISVCFLSRLQTEGSDPPLDLPEDLPVRRFPLQLLEMKNLGQKRLIVIIGSVILWTSRSTVPFRRGQ